MGRDRIDRRAGDRPRRVRVGAHADAVGVIDAFLVHGDAGKPKRSES